MNAAIHLCILGYILDSHRIRFWMILISYVYALFLPKIIKFFKAWKAFKNSFVYCKQNQKIQPIHFFWTNFPLSWGESRMKFWPYPYLERKGRENPALEGRRGWPCQGENSGERVFRCLEKFPSWILLWRAFNFLLSCSSLGRADFVVFTGFRQWDPGITARLHHGSHGLDGEGVGVSGRRPSEREALQI